MKSYSDPSTGFMKQIELFFELKKPGILIIIESGYLNLPINMEISFVFF